MVHYGHWKKHLIHNKFNQKHKKGEEIKIWEDKCQVLFSGLGHYAQYAMTPQSYMTHISHLNDNYS